MNSNSKNIRDMYKGINEFKRGYQPRNNLLKDENGDLLTDSHSILNRNKNYFSQLLNVHNVSDVRQIEVHTAEKLVPGPSRFEVEIAIAKLKKYKLPGSDKIPVQLIEARGETLLSIIHKLISSISSVSGNSLLLYQFTKSDNILSNILLSKLGQYINEITGDHQCG
jgi:hypothetical protein